MRINCLLMTLVAVLICQLGTAAEPGFYPLTNPLPEYIYAFAGSLSGDGAVVGGESGLSSFSPRDTVGVVWSGLDYTEITTIAPATSQQPWAYLMGLSDDGSVGAGLTNTPTGPEINDVLTVPVRWTAELGLQILTPASGLAQDISADGSVLVGQWRDASSESVIDGFRWSESTGMQSIPRLPGSAAAGNIQIAYATSADGQVVVGRAVNGDETRISVAYAWTESLGSVQLDLLPGATGATAATARAVAYGINGPGDIVVGEARDDATGRNAAMWHFDRATGESQIVNLGDLPGAPATNPTGLPNANAREVSDDGRVIIGDGQSGDGNEAFIWLADEGMLALKTYLVDSLGYTNLDGWHLSSVTDLSRDGRTIAGYGSFEGATHAWVVVLPSPEIEGDFNGNGLLDADDLGLLATAMQTNDLVFDLNRDGQTDGSDHRFWIRNLKQTSVGDSNLDGQFDSSDLISVFQSGKYETAITASWSDGDWNGDLLFDTGDLVDAFQDGGYEQGPRSAVNAVPEPASLTLSIAALGVCTAVRRTSGPASL